MIIQIGVTAVAVIALIGVIKRFRKGALSSGGFILWCVLWVAAALAVWVPQITNRIAGFLGVGRGADAVLYVSIIVLFYTMFRLYGKTERLEHELNTIVTQVALRDLDLSVDKTVK